MKKTLHWFRQDLRIHDNPSLSAAVANGAAFLLYIFADDNQIGAASRVWLHHSLQALQTQVNGKLILQQGDPLAILKEFILQNKIEEVHWNRCYEPSQIARDSHIKSELQKLGIEVKSHNGSLLWEPWEIETKSGSNYKVFTPFYRKGCLQAPPPRTVIKSVQAKQLLFKQGLSMSLDDLKLLPNKEWVQTLMQHWQPGEQAAQKQLQKFIKCSLDEYKKGRDFPASLATSRLSPYLHWGEISPNQVWYSIKKLKPTQNIDCFLSEIAWREFSYSLLYYYPTLPIKNLHTKFNKFPWRKSKKLLRAWQQGQTGYPIIDAGMRELWQTGYMHNRVRMIVASFLVKNLLIHWHEGAAWFWDCLVDADLANNSASWQWVAGCGADAAPFFRIFNPTTQAKKFDPDGSYIKKYVPELAQLPLKNLFEPWKAKAEILQRSGVELGKTYPKPIVDLSITREKALQAYKAVK